MGTNPSQASQQTPPSSQIELINGAEYFVLNYTRNLNALNVQPLAQYSENLVDWNTLGTPVFVETTQLGNGKANVKYRAPFMLVEPSRSVSPFYLCSFVRGEVY